MKYRSRMDIAAAILDVAQDGVLKTRIMYRAFMSFPQLKEYLELLQNNSLLEYERNKKLYYTTEKGKRFLKSYTELGQLLLPRKKRKNNSES